ncbi:MAG TPA: hypothetical protein VFF53_08020 [Geobacteraceae bacterium]|nr:hypothetical protein [Geobacteraceae bacterium]
MRTTQYDSVCYRTEQRDEPIRLKNLRTGAKGVTFGCTYAGETVQVRLDNGELDSWDRRECIETNN